MFNIGGIWTETTTAFSIEQVQGRLLPYANKFQNSITYEMSLDKNIYIREVYTFLDLMGDLGGLAGALTPIFAGIVKLCQYEGAYQFVMHDMFIDRNNNPGNDG